MKKKKEKKFCYAIGLYLKQMRKRYQVAVDPTVRKVFNEDGSPSVQKIGWSSIGFFCEKKDCRDVYLDDFMFWVDGKVLCSRCARQEFLKEKELNGGK